MREDPGPACVYRIRDRKGRLLHIGAAPSGPDAFVTFAARHEHESWWTQVTDIDVAHFPTLAAAEATVPGAVSAERPVHGGCTPTPHSC